ncbi:MAG TPA: protein translocase subunit SecF [bacterium]|nr:protein translocase subunit SecF [bacterium]
MSFFEIVPNNVNINFVGARKVAIVISSLVVAASLIGIFVFGFNWGIDFAGGLEMRVDFINAAHNVTIGDVRAAMAEKELPATLPLTGVQVNSFIIPGKNSYTIKAKGEENVEKAGGDTKLQDMSAELLTHLNNKFGEGNVEIVSTDMVGPRVGATLRKKGMMAIVYALIGILIYVGWRFNFRYSPGGVIALAHDVIITAGVFAFLQREINLVTIAALLTIAGYSINDTIVVYDRIREGREKKYRNKPLAIAVNNSINETLSRTLLTSATTLFVVVSLFVLGGEILRDFALALLIGITVGTYSSVFIASPVYLMLEEWFASRRKAKGALR